jgi:hypothetical protein
VEQAPEGVLGQTELADVDGVLGDAVKLPRVTSEPALVSESVGNVGNQNFGAREKLPTCAPIE